jgi:hypothetical protein
MNYCTLCYGKQELTFAHISSMAHRHWDMVMQKDKLTAEEKNQLQLFAELFGAMDY